MSDNLEFSFSPRAPVEGAGAEMPQTAEQDVSFSRRSGEPDYENMGALDVAGSAVTHALPSAWRAIKGVGEAIASPIETGTALVQIPTGLWSKAKGAVGVQQDPEQKARDEAVVNAIGREYANKYGSWAGFKKTLATDPFSIGMDVSIPFTAGAGALGQGAGVAGRLGKIAGAVGTATDPIQLALQTARGVGKGAAAVPTGLRSIQAGESGVARPALETAFTAGMTRDPLAREAFLKQASGEANQSDIARAAVGGLSAKKDAASADYLSRLGAMDRAAAQSAPLPFDDINAALQNSLQEIRFGGLQTGQFPTQTQALNHANVLINGKFLDGSQAFIDINTHALHPVAGPGRIPASGWVNGPPETRSLLGLDKLKKSIYGLVEQYPDARPQLMNIYDGVKNTINKADPAYGKLMDDWQSHINLTNDLTKTLGLGRNTAEASRINKLLRGQKSPHGNTLIDEIAATDQGKYIREMLAGAAISTGSDVRHNILGAALSAPAALLHPLAAAVPLLMAQPKVAGMSNYYLGRGAGAVRDVAESIHGAAPAARAVAAGASRVLPAVTSTPSTQALLRLAQAKKAQQGEPPGELDYGGFGPSDGSADTFFSRRPQRASGGGVNEADIHERLVQRLMNLAETAKKTTQKSSEGLLKAPDEAIVHALKVADSAI